MRTLDESHAEFCRQFHSLVNGEAEKKGYALADDDGRPLVDFVAEHCGDGHALGEIVYKVIRWRSKRDPKDILKVAAWAFLEWDRAQRKP